MKGRGKGWGHACLSPLRSLEAVQWHCASLPAPFHSLFLHTAVALKFSHHGNAGSSLLAAPYPSIFPRKSYYDVYVRGITLTEGRSQSWNGQLIIFAEGFLDATHSGLLFSDFVTSSPQSSLLRWHHYFLSTHGEIGPENKVHIQRNLGRCRMDAEANWRANTAQFWDNSRIKVNRVTNANTLGQIRIYGSFWHK